MATRGNITVTCPILGPEGWCDSCGGASDALVCYRGSSRAAGVLTC